MISDARVKAEITTAGLQGSMALVNLVFMGKDSSPRRERRNIS